MNPETVLLAITAVGNAVTEACRLAQTPQGQELIKKSLADRAAWDAFWKPAGDWLTALFAGKLGV